MSGSHCVNCWNRTKVSRRRYLILYRSGEPTIGMVCKSCGIRHAKHSTIYERLEDAELELLKLTL